MSFFKKINWQNAIGEVIIVILGISIAFGLNNWKEGRNAQNQKEVYLVNISKDLQIDMQQLDSNIIILKRKMDDIDTIRKYIRNPAQRNMKMLQSIYYISTPIEFRPRNITYTTLINSGDLKLINDFQLKSAIQEHYLEYEHILETYERQNIISDKYVGDYFMFEMDYGAIYSGDFSFMDYKLFQNIMGALYTTFKIKIEASEQGISNCEKLIKIIEEQ